MSHRALGPQFSDLHPWHDRDAFPDFKCPECNS